MRRLECRLNIPEGELHFVFNILTYADVCTADSLFFCACVCCFFSLHVVKEYLFLMRSHDSAFLFSTQLLSCPFLFSFFFCLSEEAASHEFLTRTLCFISASQPLNHISVTSQYTQLLLPAREMMPNIFLLH